MLKSTELLKSCEELNKAFSGLMKQMALEAINSFPREYSCGIRAWFLMGFGLEQKACLDADAEGCSNLCLGTVLAISLGSGDFKSHLCTFCFDLQCAFLSCIPHHTRVGDWNSNLLYYFSLHTSK